jgi:hypothetical protein
MHFGAYLVLTMGLKLDLRFGEFTQIGDLLVQLDKSDRGDRLRVFVEGDGTVRREPVIEKELRARGWDGNCQDNWWKKGLLIMDTISAMRAEEML